ncbi:MAG: Gfo/Idh/MocA family oxidoreductase, partial [Chloroflexota bacterium]
FLTNSEIEEVYVQAAVMVDPEIGEVGDVDTAIINLKFANGVLGVIDNSRQAAYGYDQRVEVFGSKGMVDVGNNYPSNHRVHRADSISGPVPLHFFLERYMDAYANEIRTFIDCIVEDKPMPVTGLDGRAPVLVGLAAWQSVRENRPVKIAELGY